MQLKKMFNNSENFQLKAQKSAREGDLKIVEKLAHEHQLNYDKIVAEAIVGGHFANPVLAFCFLRKAITLEFSENFMIGIKRSINTYHSKIDYDLDKIIVILKKDRLKNLTDLELLLWYANRNQLRECIKNAKVVMDKNHKFPQALLNIVLRFIDIKVLNDAEQFCKKILFYYETLKLFEDNALTCNNLNNHNSLSYEIKNQIKNYKTFR